MTNLELIIKHQEDTSFCSGFSHMRSCSSTYSEIVLKGKEIVPDILSYLVDNNHHAGMSIMLLLWDITGESPYKPNIVGNTGMLGFNVREAKNAWIQWGKEKGYLK